MDLQAKRVIIHAHGITTVLIGKQLYALDVYTYHGVTGFEWLNITQYTSKDLKQWLGY